MRIFSGNLIFPEYIFFLDTPILRGYHFIDFRFNRVKKFWHGGILRNAREVVLYYCFNGRYVSEDEPDSGYTAVFKAVRRKDKEPVAVKVWEKDAPEGKREAEIWKSAFPEYFIEAKNDGRRFILVRRWIEGISLAEFAEKYGPMEAAKAVAVCLCVALRLRRFYQATGKYYGDLRPENVILGRSSVFFVDFESAGDEAGEGGAAKNFKSKTLKFVSPGFAAPEVYRGRACCASDFFAIGVLLNFLMTGEASDGGEKLPEGRLKDFLRKCCEKKPEDRFGSIEALAAELGDILRKTGGSPFGSLEDEIGFYLGGGRFGDGEETGPREGTGMHLFPGKDRDDVDDFEREFESLIFPEEDGTADVSFPDDAGGGEGSVEEIPEDTTEYSEDEPDGNPQDEAILFPHYEKGYRRLMLYVPGNVSFATELGYVFCTCFGLKTCVYELFDYAPPRLTYYLTPVEESIENNAFSGKNAYNETAGTAYCGGYDDAFLASEESVEYEASGLNGNGRDDESSEGIIQRFSRACMTGDFRIKTVRSEESPRLFIGAGTLEDLGEPDDDFMRSFMAGAYTDYDITVVCDSMLESRESSVRVMRYCDYVLLPVKDEADEFETATAHYTRLLGENRISKERLKVVCWEKSGTGAGAELLGVTGGKYEFAGSIGYDSDRQYFKNVAGDVYCRNMKGEIIRQYCDIASRLTYGERFCA